MLALGRGDQAEADLALRGVHYAHAADEVADDAGLGLVLGREQELVALHEVVR